MADHLHEVKTPMNRGGSLDDTRAGWTAQLEVIVHVDSDVISQCKLFLDFYGTKASVNMKLF